MKTLLVATDFSRISLNAAHYAAEIAKLAHAKLILFHVYHPPSVLTEVPILVPLTELEADTLKSLNTLADELKAKHGELNIECFSQFGFAVEEISLFAEENDIDLIVTGMKGAGYLSQRLIGSTTTSLIYKASRPVLAIDEQAEFKNLKKIVLAFDYKKAHSASVLEPLEEFADLFNAHIYVLNVLPELESVLIEHESSAARLEQSLRNREHSFHYVTDEDVTAGIREFVEDQQADMLVMVPGTHSMIENLFREPQTKKMAFHTHIPLLSLHNRN